MIRKFERFLQTREALRNCSPKTLRYYRQAWDVWGKFLPERAEDITDEVVEDVVIALKRHPRLKPVSVKTYLRALNVFLGFLKVVPRVDLKVIIVPKFTPKLFSQEQISALLQGHPNSIREARVILALAIVADTGLRAEEVLGLRCTDIEMNASLIHVYQGKGSKDREVPVSSKLRRRLAIRLREGGTYVFETRHGRPWSYRNSLRDVKLYCKRLGISGPRISWHTLRHSFGTNYIAKGGSIEMLSRILGHTTLTMTQRYVHLQTEDLRRVHDRLTMVK